MGNKPPLDLPDTKFSDHLYHYLLSYAGPELLKFYDNSTEYCIYTIDRSYSVPPPGIVIKNKIKTYIKIIYNIILLVSQI